jgi:hypothetical protein
MVLEGGPSTLVLNIKLDFNLETVLDRRRCTVVVLDIKLGSKLGTGLDRELCTLVNPKLGLALDNELKFLAKVIKVIRILLTHSVLK